MLHHRLEVSEVWMGSLLVKFESRLTQIESILQKLSLKQEQTPTKLDGLKWHHCKSTGRTTTEHTFLQTEMEAIQNRYHTTEDLNLTCS